MSQFQFNPFWYSSLQIINNHVLLVYWSLILEGLFVNPLNVSDLLSIIIISIFPIEFVCSKNNRTLVTLRLEMWVCQGSNYSNPNQTTIVFQMPVFVGVCLVVGMSLHSHFKFHVYLLVHSSTKAHQPFKRMYFYVIHCQ